MATATSGKSTGLTGYNLPWNVSTNEWLNFEGKKSSKSRKIGVWIDEALRLAPADYWRYTLIANRPETKDTNFTWTIFLEKVNSDLNDTLGNFIHRALTFIDKYYDGRVPSPKNMEQLDKQVLETIKESYDKIENALKHFQLQAAVREVIELSREGNKYLNEKKPWKTVKEDQQTTANTLYVAAQIVKALSVLLEPFVPFSAEKLRDMLNISPTARWNDAIKPLTAGHNIKKPKPLFHKIEKSETELSEALEKVRKAAETVSFEDFSKMDLRVGTIIEVKPIPGSKKLLKLQIDVGENRLKTAVAGIAEYYKPSDLEGKQVVVIVNLEPRKIFGIKSEVMILAAQDGRDVVLLQPEKPIKTGAEIS